MKQTLGYAQSLYEKKLLTYSCTDSRYLTSDMAETVSCVIHLLAAAADHHEALPSAALLRSMANAAGRSFPRGKKTPDAVSVGSFL